MNRLSFSKFFKVWNDPVWSKVIAAAFVALLAAVCAYLQGWGPVIHAWFISSTSLPNWLIFILVLLSSFCALAIILKIFPTSRYFLKKDIKQLVANTVDMSVPVVTLLRKAKIIATQAGQVDFLGWIDKELKGYEGVLAEDLPPYRRLYGEPKALNPHRGGWESVQFSDAKIRKLFSYAPNGQDIGSLEETLNLTKDGSTLIYHLSPKQKQMALEALKGCTDFHVVVNITTLHRILTEVRNRVHEWALGLDNEKNR